MVRDGLEGLGGFLSALGRASDISVGRLHRPNRLVLFYLVEDYAGGSRGVGRGEVALNGCGSSLLVTLKARRFTYKMYWV